MNALRWNAFWFGSPRGEEIPVEGVVIRSTAETGVLLARLGIKVRLLPNSKIRRGYDIVVGNSLYDLESEKSEYQRLVSGLSRYGEPRPQILSECHFDLPPIKLLAPDSQHAVETDERYTAAATRFMSEQLRYSECPCEFWIPYFDDTDPKGFALIEDRNKQRYFLAFYWDDAKGELVLLPGDAPHYRPSAKAVQRLEEQILRTAKVHEKVPG